MNTNKLFTKTMKFAWMKLGLGLATVISSILLLLICTGISFAAKSDHLFFIMIVVWLSGTAGISSVLNHYFGYLVKAGHIAVITEALKTGSVPEDQVNTAFSTVKGRFVTSNVYFVVDRLISSAVKQLQSGVDTVDSILGNIPGLSVVFSFIKLFIGMALNYVDECCLGYTFYNNKQNVFKSAADGVVIYFQNWKRLLKNALTMTLLLIVMVIGSTIVIFSVFNGLFYALGWNVFIAFILSFYLSIAIKHAFIDSYLMIKMMVSYLEVAPQTVITFDLYEKLCKLSRKFSDLFHKGTADQPATASASTSSSAATSTIS